ncbi:helix-turn-helix transcriptional regulator [Rhizobium laguerreae]|uniref:winged helix-turn-helix transcriptional regulator n=1 Tax=Rhizobium laguerreae TaxID=1076926 RepID=UPI001C8FB5FE|nr:helix-turn-helix domain-containing protein [Rhizobium laguerreae]MBY3217726.1 helix-turn-helix transcriptional regulator [Rhizobium laguerreae]
MTKPTSVNCGLGPALRIVGGKWRPTIIWELHSGPLRFGELGRRISGISEKVLLEELRGLEGAGVVHRAAFDEKPLRVVYSLTAIGVELNQAIHTLAEWGRRHAASKAPPDLVKAGSNDPRDLAQPGGRG